MLNESVMPMADEYDNWAWTSWNHARLGLSPPTIERPMYMVGGQVKALVVEGKEVRLHVELNLLVTPRQDGFRLCGNVGFPLRLASVLLQHRQSVDLFL